jgi:hypothetical protein
MVKSIIVLAQTAVRVKGFRVNPFGGFDARRI